MVNARKKRHNQGKRKSPPGSVKGQTGIVRTPRGGVPPQASSITRHMRVADVIALVPGAERVFAEYGIHCAGCSMGGLETLEEGSRLHGFAEEEIAELVDDLNTLFMEMPERPQELTVTLAAARAAKQVTKSEGQDMLLLVTADGNGGFCMEFQDALPDGVRTFTNAEESGVCILADDITLRRIGGATIDFREGRFKLDLAD